MTQTLYINVVVVVVTSQLSYKFNVYIMQRLVIIETKRTKMHMLYAGTWGIPSVNQCNTNLVVYLHLRYPVWWVQGSRRHPFPVAVQNVDLILSFDTRARSRTRLKSPSTQTEQREDKGRKNGPTFRHFK